MPSVIAFRDVDEAAALANGTRYGLVGAVRTRDVGNAQALGREPEAGQGFEGLLAFTRTKTVAIAVD